MKTLLSLCLFFGFVIVAKGQNEISGKVLDSLTREPIQFANVYLANTSIGTTTNEKGEFLVKNFASGKYDMIVSFIGYESVHLSIDFTNTVKKFEIYLHQKVTRLNEVVISPDTSHRAENFLQFKKCFLGETSNALACKILQPKNINLYYDAENRMLTGFAKRPIEIENKALGYKIIYDLQDFAADYRNHTQVYLGIPRFENLVPKNSSQQKRWEKERIRAYEGSFTHLIHLLKQGILNGPFVLQELYRVPNRKRPSDKFLSERINHWRKKFTGTSFNFSSVKRDSKTDSLLYYASLQRQPKIIDSLGRIFTEPNQLLDTSRENIIYSGMLKVIYKNESEEPAYAAMNKRPALKEQWSVIHLSGKKIAIYDNGYYESVSDVLFEGYMSWAEKIANLLPLEYLPPQKKQ